MKILVGLFAALALASCVSTPQSYDFDNSRIINKGYDETWASISRFFTSRSIQIKTIEKDSGLIYAERIVQDGQSTKDEFMECPSTFMMTVKSRMLQMNIFARPVSGGTEVTVNTNMTITLCNSYACVSDACNSTGRLETLLLDSVSTGG